MQFCPFTKQKHIGMHWFNGVQTQINCKMAQRLRCISKQNKIFIFFYQKDTHQVEMAVTVFLVKWKDQMNLLGVKLTWAIHVSIQTNKANNALHAIKLIRKYFNQEEILSLLTSNFYSIRFYNPEVWQIPSLKRELKQILLSNSANALKISQRTPDRYESFVNIHIALKEHTQTS